MKPCLTLNGLSLYNPIMATATAVVQGVEVALGAMGAVMVAAMVLSPIIVIPSGFINTFAKG